MADTLRLAESLGAETATIHAEAHIADEILDFARSRNVSRIVLGRPRPRRLLAWLARETVAEEIIRKGEDFEITIISPEREEARKAAIAPPAMAQAWEPKAYAWSTLITAISSSIAILVDRVFPFDSLSLFFFVGALGGAAPI